MNAIRSRFALTGNQLKLLAMLTMTIDHIGAILLPQYRFLRVIGRLSMPIYAFMIAEGCHHTHDRKAYFLRLLGLALLCQVVYAAVDRSLYQCILVTFSLSVALICAVEWAQKKRTPGSLFTTAVLIIGIYFVCEKLPLFLPGFHVDYGIWGVLLPVIVYFGGRDIVAFGLGVLLLCLSIGHNQWWAMLTIPLIALYNGQRGRHRLGWLFYLYYPAHLVILYAISYLV